MLSRDGHSAEFSSNDGRRCGVVETAWSSDLSWWIVGIFLPPAVCGELGDTAVERELEKLEGEDIGRSVDFRVGVRASRTLR